MTIEELENKHYKLNKLVALDYAAKRHTKLSIEFAISILEDLEGKSINVFTLPDKIQELKQHLK